MYIDHLCRTVLVLRYTIIYLPYFGENMEKMLCLIHAGRIVFAFAFIVSAWREYDDERAWLVFNLNGEEAAEEYIILGIVMKAKYIIGLGIMMKLYGGISFLSTTYPGALILVYQFTSLSYCYV
ncbi:uncharacterized protein LOC125577062 [Brassica napus]|uniref:uncharacterized protein LOC125577062 n=1 Tax=Brassica napus TaxID=3708 RepID=UPI00207895A4|nr:uncharacterized protein LOC125577062 [Brassica napus]